MRWNFFLLVSPTPPHFMSLRNRTHFLALRVAAPRETGSRHCSQFGGITYFSRQGSARVTRESHPIVTKLGRISPEHGQLMRGERGVSMGERNITAIPEIINIILMFLCFQLVFLPFVKRLCKMSSVLKVNL